MKNIKAILLALNQLEAAAKYAFNAANNIQMAALDGVDASAYEDMVFGAIRHTQVIALELTKLASEADENYDSVFAAGELNSVKEVEEPQDLKAALIEKAKMEAQEEEEYDS